MALLVVIVVVVAYGAVPPPPLPPPPVPPPVPPLVPLLPPPQAAIIAKSQTSATAAEAGQFFRWRSPRHSKVANPDSARAPQNGVRDRGNQTKIVRLDLSALLMTEGERETDGVRVTITGEAAPFARFTVVG